MNSEKLNVVVLGYYAMNKVNKNLYKFRWTSDDKLEIHTDKGTFVGNVEKYEIVQIAYTVDE